MGTVVTALLVDEAAGTVSIGHVGDSRAYRLRDDALEQLTPDHSLVGELVRAGRLSTEEAEQHPHRSVITRAVGTEPTVEVDTFTIEAAPGDLYLICSDGLTDIVRDDADPGADRSRPSATRTPPPSRSSTPRTATAASTTSPSSSSRSSRASRCRRARRRAAAAGRTGARRGHPRGAGRRAHSRAGAATGARQPSRRGPGRSLARARGDPARARRRRARHLV